MLLDSEELGVKSAVDNNVINACEHAPTVHLRYQ